MHKLKKTIIFLILLYQYNNKNIDFILTATFGVLSIYFSCYKYAADKNLHIDNHNKTIITKNIENYLHKDHQFLLNHISFIDNYSDHISTTIYASISSALLHELRENKNWNFNLLFFVSEYVLIHFIKKCLRTNDNKKINSILNNNIFNHSAKNIIIQNTINFFTPYILLILNPSDENKKIIDQTYPLYNKIYKIEKNINQLEKNNFEKILSESTKHIDNIMKKINSEDPFITILSTEFNDQISTIENLLEQNINIDANINTYILPYKEEIENEDFINILEIKKETSDIIKTIPLIKFNFKEINNFSLNVIELKNKIILLKKIKESPGYLSVLEVADKINRLNKYGLDVVSKEALEKLKNLTNQIAFKDMHQYLSTDIFLNNIKNLDDKINKINTEKKTLDKIMADIHTILNNKNINFSDLKNEINLYEKKIKQITLDNAENILNNYIKRFNEDTKKYFQFIDSFLCKKHIDLYNKIEKQYLFLEKKHFSEKTTYEYLKSTQLEINNSNSIIEEKISNLEKYTEEMSLIINILKQIKIEKNKINNAIQKSNQYLCVNIFKNFPQETYINEKNYYFFNYNELINYQNDLIKKKELQEKNNNILYFIETKLQEYYLNNTEIQKMINCIQSLTIYKTYIKNSEEYKKTENTFKNLLSKKIEYDHNNFHNEFYQQIIINLINESKNFLQIIDQQYKNYLENEKNYLEFNKIIENLPKIALYNQESINFILKQKNYFNVTLLKNFNDLSKSQSNNNDIKNIIHQTKDYCNLITTENKKIEKVISMINDQKKNICLFVSFNKNEISSIEKAYNKLKDDIYSNFNSFLANSKIPLNESEYIAYINNFRSILINLDKNIIEIENNLITINNEKIKIEEEENKYKNLLTKYQIIEAKDLFINLINAIDSKKKYLELYRIDIRNKINNLWFLYTNSLINNTYKIKDIKDIIDLKKKYYDNKKNIKKTICNTIKKKLEENLKQISDEKKAEYNDIIETTDNELTECESSSIETIEKIDNSVNKSLAELLNN
jgi:hypothetical protein